LTDKGIEQVFILGGAQIYDKTINIADKLIISEIHTAADGDAFFPTIDKTIWSEVSREDHKADEHNKYDYSFVVYEKTKKN
jgi:dihydrofolate reductase